MGRAQVSLEYLIIVGLALALLIPAVAFFLNYTKSNERTSTNSQINDIGLKMVATVKSTYSLGKNAKQTLEFVMPPSVQRVYVTPEEITFVYENELGTSESVFFSSIAMRVDDPAGDISVVHPGITRYQFQSLGTEVNISEVLN